MMRFSGALCLALFAIACDTPQAARWVPTAATPAALPPPPIPGRDAPILVDGTDVSVGQSVRSQVEPADPACFPNWDAGGQCQQFNLTAPQDGLLDATLKWNGLSRGYAMTLFFVHPDGGWTYAAEGTPDARLNVPIAAGNTYRLIVMSYATPQSFELTTALR
jgi:hypothetical protein